MTESLGGYGSDRAPHPVSGVGFLLPPQRPFPTFERPGTQARAVSRSSPDGEQSASERAMKADRRRSAFTRGRRLASFLLRQPRRSGPCRAEGIIARRPPLHLSLTRWFSRVLHSGRLRADDLVLGSYSVRGGGLDPPAYPRRRRQVRSLRRIVRSESVGVIHSSPPGHSSASTVAADWDNTVAGGGHALRRAALNPHERWPTAFR